MIKYLMAGVRGVGLVILWFTIIVGFIVLTGSAIYSGAVIFKWIWNV